MSHAVVVLSDIIGWAYFLAWSISFYPQVYENWKRKSVEGLSFDFLFYNITGYIGYSIFNLALYFSHTVQVEYKHKYATKDDPDPAIPVEPNDIAFALHALFITIVTIGQCFIYERGNQKNSKIALGIIAAIWVSIFINLFLTVGSVTNWLWFVYWFSYMKLLITLLKYIPQAYMNFSRKSTVGWSIGNVLLDFSGGVLSFLQMFLTAFDTSDWEIFYGNPTKLGLAVISILFDILFMIQHYILYPKARKYENLEKQKDQDKVVLI